MNCDCLQLRFILTNTYFSIREVNSDTVDCLPNATGSRRELVAPVVLSSLSEDVHLKANDDSIIWHDKMCSRLVSEPVFTCCTPGCCSSRLNSPRTLDVVAGVSGIFCDGGSCVAGLSVAAVVVELPQMLEDVAQMR